MDHLFKSFDKSDTITGIIAEQENIDAMVVVYKKILHGMLSKGYPLEVAHVHALCAVITMVILTYHMCK